MTKTIKHIVPWTFVIEDVDGRVIAGTFYKTNFEKQIKQILDLKT